MCIIKERQKLGIFRSSLLDLPVTTTAMLRKSRLALLAVPVFPKLENILQNEELYLCCIFVSSNTFRMREKNINKEREDQDYKLSVAI